MNRWTKRKFLLWNDTRGQDLIEYALTAGFVAVAVGVVMPNMALQIFTIFTKASSLLLTASSS
jgi:pilus assembly protein Flp/PilA